ncbi:MAG: hypothetical protein SangKO_036550 [Sandaracinaceae bacterium]
MRVPPPGWAPTGTCYPREFESPDRWYTYSRPIDVEFGSNRSAPTFTTTSQYYLFPGQNDAVLIYLNHSVPASVAVPARVMTRLPAGESAASLLSGQLIRGVGWGGREMVSRSQLPGQESVECVATDPGSDKLDCFTRAGSSLYHTARNNPAGAGWTTPALVANHVHPDAEVSCVSWGPGRIDCFYRSTSDTLKHIWATGSSFFGPEDLGGSIAGSPECVSWDVGRLDCVARWADSSLRAISYEVGGPPFATQAWQNLGGAITGTPSCSSWEPGRLDCFARGVNGGLHHIWYRDHWQYFEFMGAPSSTVDVMASPHAREISCVDANATGSIDCMVRGSDRNLYRLTYRSGAGWSPWASHGGGGKIETGPDCVSKETYRVDCFAGSDNETLRHFWTSDAASGTWRSEYSADLAPGLSNQFDSGVSCVSYDADHLDCFAIDQDSALRHFWWANASSGLAMPTRFVRQQGFFTFGQMPSGPAPNQMRLDNALGVELIGGDSGGPAFFTDYAGVPWVIGVRQSGGPTTGDVIATFGPGGTVGPGHLYTGCMTADMGAWLERYLPPGIPAN